jgi:protocatechuate 3,4-dioxygenase beta subunit
VDRCNRIAGSVVGDIVKRPIATGMVALAVAIVVWRTAARSATRPPSVRNATAAAAIAKRKPDPRNAARATINGHVTIAGKPAAGAHVCAAASGLGELGRDAICVDTDATGAYSLGELLTADYHITANARGTHPMSVHQHLDAGAHVSVDLALATGGVELSGVVTDIAGGPIGHAQLRADDTLVEADDQGRFSLWVEPTDVMILATADGYAPATWNGRPPDRVELRMQPESSLAGTVVAADGTPVPDAKVEVDGVDWRLPSASTTTGDDGTFHADRLAPGRYTVTVRSPSGFGTSDGSVLVQMADHADGVVVTLVPAAHVEAKVLTADGKPCGDGGWVRIVDEDHGRSLDGMTDETGSLEIDGVMPGTYKVHVTCMGYLNRDADPIEVGKKDVTGLVWKLEAGSTLHGKIRLKDGTAVAGAEVRVQGESWGTATSAADGSYTITGLPAGTYTMTATSAHAVSPSSESFEVGDRATVEHDYEMDAGGTIKGVVVDGRGQPVAGANVQLRDTYANARTSADGGFVLAPVFAGEHEIAVQISDYRLTRDSVDGPVEALATVTVSPGETATTRIVVDVEPATVSGVVVDGNGAGVRDVVVELLDSSDISPPPVLTGDNGAFKFPAVKGAHYKVHASAPGRGERYVDADASEPLKIQLEAGALVGIVHGAPEELSIMMTGASYRTETFFHTGGRFSLQDLRPGHYNISIDSESGHLDLDREVADGPAEPLDLTLDPVFTLTGRVVKGDNHAPVEGAHVQLRIGGTRMPDDGDGAVTDATGRFTIKRARKGTAEVRITVAADGNRWMEATVSGPELDDLVIPSDQPVQQYYDESE